MPEQTLSRIALRCLVARRPSYCIVSTKENRLSCDLHPRTIPSPCRLPFSLCQCSTCVQKGILWWLAKGHQPGVQSELKPKRNLLAPLSNYEQDTKMTPSGGGRSESREDMFWIPPDTQRHVNSQRLYTHTNEEFRISIDVWGLAGGDEDEDEIRNFTFCSPRYTRLYRQLMYDAVATRLNRHQ